MNLPLEVFEDRTSSVAEASFPRDPVSVNQHPASAQLQSPRSRSTGPRLPATLRAGPFAQHIGSPGGGAVLQGPQLRSHPPERQRTGHAVPVAEHGYQGGLEPPTAGYGPVRSCRSHAPPRMPYGKNWWCPPPQLGQQQQQLPGYAMPQQTHPHPLPLHGPGYVHGHGQRDQGMPEQRHGTVQPPLPVVQPPFDTRAAYPALPLRPPAQRAFAPQPGPPVQRSKIQGETNVVLRQTPGHAPSVQNVPGRAKQRQPAPQPPLLSQLHKEVEAFAQRASPTQAETEAVKEVERIVRDAALAIWPDCEVGLFGSQCCSMALPGSDVDITILDVGGPPKKGAAGFTMKQRKGVVQELRRLLKSLKKLRLVCGNAQVIPARIPIVKCHLVVHGVKMAADISMGVKNGVEAVPFIMQQVHFFGPSLRALTVIMKALLKQRNLNERVSGGLGSYCVLNVVMAHLMKEGIRAKTNADLGHLLLSLLRFFGRAMDCSRQAISVRMGGVVEKQQQWQQEDRPFLLAVEDPQQPGTDIGSGSFNIQEVRSCAARAHDVLYASCCSAAVGGAGPEAASWGAVQAEGQSFSVAPPATSEFPLLNTILDTSLALDRSASASQARMAISSQPAAKMKVKAKRNVKAKRSRGAATSRTHHLLGPGAKGQPTAEARNQAKKKLKARKASLKRNAAKGAEQSDQPKKKRRKVQKPKTDQ